MRDDVTLYGDSGGYQASSKGVELDVPNILKWQETNCDYGFMFDKPPYHAARTPVNDSDFLEYMEITYQQTKQAVDLRDMSKPVTYFNILHGHTLERREVWYDRLIDLPCEHLCNSVRPASKALSQAFGICWLHSKGYTGRVHHLGVGGMNVLPVFVYAQDMFEVLTTDSSSYGQGVRTRQYFSDQKLPIFLGTKGTDSASMLFKDQIKIDGIPCDCPYCKSIDKTETEILSAPGSLGGSLITGHNLCYVLNYCDRLEEVYAAGKDEYRAYIKVLTDRKALSANTMLAIHFIDDYFKMGIERTYSKYKKVLLDPFNELETEVQCVPLF